MSGSRKRSLFYDIFDGPSSQDDRYRTRMSIDAKNSLELLRKMTKPVKVEGHKGCVNTLFWSEDGQMLLSGSDDQHIGVCNPFTSTRTIHRVRTKHRANIFSARFLPQSNNREVVSCSGDGVVQHTNLDMVANAQLDVNGGYCTTYFACHTRGTTYEVTTIPNEPRVFLSCGEDATVRLFDLRFATSCYRSNCMENVLIYSPAATTAMALSPTSQNYIAVGSSGSNVRIYDRRYLAVRNFAATTDSSVDLYTVPLKLYTNPTNEKRPFRVTSIEIDRSEQQMLVNYSSDHVYLFNLMHPGLMSSLRVPLVSEWEIVGRIPKRNTNRQPTSGEGPTPVRRLRLRGDWSDTGPEARPSQEANSSNLLASQDRPRLQATIMTRMAEMMAQMLADPQLREGLRSRASRDRLVFDAEHAILVAATRGGTAPVRRLPHADQDVAEQEPSTSDSPQPEWARPQERPSTSVVRPYFRNLRPRPLQSSTSIASQSSTSQPATARVQNRSMIRTQHSSPSRAPQPSTAIESQPSTSTISQPASCTVPQSSASKAQQPSTSRAPEPSTSRAPEPSTSRSPQPSTSRASESSTSRARALLAPPISLETETGTARRNPTIEGRNTFIIQHNYCTCGDPSEEVITFDTFDYVVQKYVGHRNARTLMKEAKFWGDNFVMSGSDCGGIFTWDRKTAKLVMLMAGDNHVVNCIQPHPTLPILATSGIDYDIKIWEPTAEESQFDEGVASKLMERNAVMLEETRDIITVPASFMIRMLACLHTLRNRPLKRLLKTVPSVQERWIVGGEAPVLIIVSYDGFRTEYLQRNSTSYMNELRHNGTTSAYLRNVFPTKTFPNHHSIATGVYPNVHGVLSSTLYDSQQGDLNYSYELYHFNPTIMPIWALNQLAGGHSGCMMWPGSDFGYGPSNATCSHVQPLNISIPWTDRINTIFRWIRDTDRPANLIMLYIEEPDYYGHVYGPDSDRIEQLVVKLNDLTRQLHAKIADLRLQERVNVVHLSDHGMEPVMPKHFINLTALVADELKYDTYGTSPVLQIVPKVKQEKSELYRQLRKAADEDVRFDVYMLENLPARWRYNNSRRTGPITAVAQLGYAFDDMWKTVEYYRQHFGVVVTPDTQYGLHGYDNFLPVMNSIFFAYGPSIREQLTVEPFDTVDLFYLFCEILNLMPPTYLEGNVNHIQHILSNSSRDDDDDDPNGGNSPDSSRAETIAVIFAGSLVVSFAIVSLFALAVIYQRRRREHMVPPYLYEETETFIDEGNKLLHTSTTNSSINGDVVSVDV
ncbi:DDB1- and CUL4-associated factor 6-like [Anopheles nili]|uniref:DDB1- and CUL4-associated factor 6-like n=1 Tax=Anopheles nili TaxID=185578 RepID=UPI00237A26C1|nr:DDB1- and CUL4-associated factor 6-like [Anopheles nili]